MIEHYILKYHHQHQKTLLINLFLDHLHLSPLPILISLSSVRLVHYFVAPCLSLPPNWWRERSPIRSPTLQPPSGINSQYSSKLSQQRSHSQCAGKAASGDRHLHRSQRSRISFNPNRLRLKLNPRRLSSKRSSRQAYLPLTLTPLPKGGECDRRLHSSPVLTSQA